jgi:hypothetical protein
LSDGLSPPSPPEQQATALRNQRPSLRSHSASRRRSPPPYRVAATRRAAVRTRSRRRGDSAMVRGSLGPDRVSTLTTRCGVSYTVAGSSSPIGSSSGSSTRRCVRATSV